MNPKHKNFDYSLRVSKRARYVRLAVKPFVGLEVVIPKRFPRQQIERILHQHRDWITTELDKHARTFCAAQLPAQISLPLLERTVDIVYQPSSRARLEEAPHQLRVYYRQQDDAIQSLRQWIRQQAKQQLPPRLQALADEFGFSFQRVSIRSQKSRWGSCSSNGTISLNDQLMFLAEDSVRYLLIHELCHTRHMNHSADFWQLVAHCCVDYRRHERTLNAGREQVPAWFLQSLYC